MRPDYAVSRLLASSLYLLASLSACGAPSDPLTPATNNPAPPPGPPQRVAIEGRLAFVSTRDGAEHIYIADSSGIRRLTTGMKPSWSPDGRRLAFHRKSSPGIRVINADGSVERSLTTEGWNPAWSPDGTRIAFNSGVGDPSSGIFIMRPDGTEITQVVSSEFVNVGDWIGLPAWSPDSRSIAFVRANYEEPWQVYIVDANGGTPRPLFNSDFIPSQSEPAWSPDGATVAIEIFRGIARVAPGGSAMLVHGPAGFSFDPDWSPDGQSLVFNRFSGPPEADSPFGSRMRIYVAAINDGPVRQLIPEAIAATLPNYWDYQATWSRITR